MLEKTSNLAFTSIYTELGISNEVLEYSNQILTNLKDRFEQIDRISELNQLKVLNLSFQRILL